MSVLILRNTDLVVSDLTFSAPKVNEHGGKAMYINVKKDGKVHKECLIQTPWMFNPFGMTTSMDTGDGSALKHYVELSVGTSPSQYVSDFHNKLKAMDRHVQDSAIANSRIWLSVAEVDQEYLDTFYKPIVRPYKNKEKVATGQYPDMVKFKVPFYPNEDGTASFGDLEVYDDQKQRIMFTTIDELKNIVGRSNRVRAIVKAHSVWQSGKEFGVSWNVVRLQILGSETIGTDCQIVGSDDEGGGANSDEDSF
jgi:hypothetical protein